MTYYVDATRGDDRRNGQSVANAWKTIARVNATSFLPGDSILFKAGETWSEQLTFSNSGDAGNPIIYGSYDPGDHPVIDVAGTAGRAIYSNGKSNVVIGDLRFAVLPPPVYTSPTVPKVSNCITPLPRRTRRMAGCGAMAGPSG